MGQMEGASMDTVRFLKRCAGCGGWRGEVAAQEGERAIRVSCRCESGKCPRCGRPTMQALSAHAFDELAGRFWHAPAVRTRCLQCGTIS